MPDEVQLNVRVPQELKATIDRHLAEHWLRTGERLSLEAWVTQALVDALARAAPDLERELTERGFQPVPFRQERSGRWVPDV